MERSDLPDKLFAEDTLSFPHSVDGERPARYAVPGDAAADESAPNEEMLAVEYRDEEVRTAAPHLHTPGADDASPEADRTH
ncbi:MAG: hypothetical protein ACYDAR_18155 [Thermomicrobiales bacterium]